MLLPSILPYVVLQPGNDVIVVCAHPRVARHVCYEQVNPTKYALENRYKMYFDRKQISVHPIKL